jgi:hypothetical protein
VSHIGLGLIGLIFIVATRSQLATPVASTLPAIE